MVDPRKGKPDMPAVYSVPLVGFDPAQIPPHHLHAAMCGALGRHDAQVKGWSVGPMAAADGVVDLVVRCADDSLRGSVVEAFAVGSSLVFGREQALVVGPPRLVVEVSWGALATASGADRWDVEFLTPMSIQAGKRYSPFPGPFSVVPSLRARWSALSPAAMAMERFDTAELASVWVSAIGGTTVVQHIAHQKPVPARPLVVPGFVGRVTYRCPDPQVAGRVDCLMRFAEFSGIGANTSHGLGAVRVTPGGAGAARRASKP
jgi:CRISPR-associated endoribonuclease Cas6